MKRSFLACGRFKNYARAYVCERRGGGGEDVSKNSIESLRKYMFM